MKKSVTLFLALLMLFSAPVLAASLPAPAAAATTTNPDPNVVKSALDEFKHLSRSERRGRLKEAKKVVKEYRAKKKAGLRDDADTNTILLVLLAIILPPLAVYLHENEANAKFWISLVLSLLVILFWPLWLIAIAYALLVVLDAI
jgi:uncharacterized membrane protein YqaE (UPF0057 family)